MKRLLELEPEARLLARAHELIRATGPTVPSEARLQQVRRALEVTSRRPAPSAWLRVAVAFALLGVGASALALGGAFDSPAQAPGPAPKAPPPATRPVPSAAKPVAPPSEAREPAIQVAPPPVAETTPRRAPAPAPARSSDVARVHEAAKALRGQGDAERALSILDSGGEVSGPLAEEALALRIEAAMVRGDARAAALARNYVARYPNGRYQDLAQRALAASKR